ncbi:MAG: hypothetical protein AAF533_14815 [Acidobacteriota bacterium]
MNSKQRDHYLGVALLIIGGLALGLKLVPWLVKSLLGLWPLVLIYLGWRMFQRAQSDGGSSSGESSAAPPP